MAGTDIDAKPRLTYARTRDDEPRPVQLSRHETLLLALYRAAAPEARAAVDASLFEAWTHAPCSLDARAPDTLRFRVTMQWLHERHLAGALSGFAGFWTGRQRRPEGGAR
jgi:hypothetical protein